MRFDDSLRTVLAIDTSTTFGASAAWRQLVDLLGRGRAPATAEVMGRLRAIRPRVAAPVRVASARSLALASPDEALVGLFAEDDLAIAAPVLRTANLEPASWVALLPSLSPPLRAVLRHRRDLPDEVADALTRFGPIDFVLTTADDEDDEQATEPRLEPASLPKPGEDAASPSAPVPDQVPELIAQPDPPLAPSPFVAVGAVARSLPVVAEARRQTADSPAPGSVIADLVARIDAFTNNRAAPAAAAGPSPVAKHFRFETDVAGTIRWVEGIARPPVIGLSIANGSASPKVDGVAAGAFRRRAPFRNARLEVEGTSVAAGSWRIAGAPLFDPATGRFTGYRGSARRPRADESAGPKARSAAADSLRQLVHELRTPTNAIAGFAELIEAELLGTVPAPYRQRARGIREEAAGLVAAIDDLETAARIAGDALELRPGQVALGPLLADTLADLAPLAALRGAVILPAPIPEGAVVDADARALERLINRLCAALVASAGREERIELVVLIEADGVVLIATRPAALAGLAADGLLSIDAEREAEAPGAPLLGTSFALRLAQNLASELGGSLVIGPDRLTLRLPAAVENGMDHASTR